MKKGLYNIVFGLTNQIFTVIMGFVLPRMIVGTYGSEVNGLISSVGQIFVYLALFEAGVGTATLQALYNPLAQKNNEQVNGILSATNRFFKKTGVFYGLALAGSSIIYPIFIKSEVPFWQIVLIILFAGIGGLLNYFFYGKYRVLLEASGHSYIVNNITTGAYIVSCLLKIWIISNGLSILLIQLMQLVYYLILWAGIYILSHKKFSWIDTNKAPDYQAIGQKNAVFVHQISSLIFSNTDMLILSFACGLKVVSVYTMYNNLFSTLMTLLLTVAASIVYILGKVYFQDRQKYQSYHNAFELIYLTAGCTLFSVLYVCVLPFMQVYTKGINDINYIDGKLAILFLIMQLLNIMRGPCNNLISVAGHFDKTKNRAVLEMLINLTVSLAGVWILGIYGVLLGTITALLYRTNDIILYANKHILNRNPWESYRRCLINLGCVISIILFYRNSYFQPAGYLDLIIYGIKNGFIILLFFCLINILFDWNNVKSTLKIIRDR